MATCSERLERRSGELERSLPGTDRRLERSTARWTLRNFVRESWNPPLCEPTAVSHNSPPVWNSSKFVWRSLNARLCEPPAVSHNFGIREEVSSSPEVTSRIKSYEKSLRLCESRARKRFRASGKELSDFFRTKRPSVRTKVASSCSIAFPRSRTDPPGRSTARSSRRLAAWPGAIARPCPRRSRGTRPAHV